MITSMVVFSLHIFFLQKRKFEGGISKIGLFFRLKLYRYKQYILLGTKCVFMHEDLQMVYVKLNKYAQFAPTWS